MSMSHVFEKPTIHATFGAISAIKRKTFTTRQMKIIWETDKNSHANEQRHKNDK